MRQPQREQQGPAVGTTPRDVRRGSKAGCGGVSSRNRAGVQAQSSPSPVSGLKKSLHCRGRPLRLERVRMKRILEKIAHLSETAAEK
jgi:hypothetical protein